MTTETNYRHETDCTNAFSFISEIQTLKLKCILKQFVGLYA